MPLQILSARIQPNTTKNFTFDDTIVQRTVGITAYTLSYGSKDHHVQTVSISLTVNQQGNTLQVTPHATLVDANGHNLDPSASEVFVAAMAWVGLNDDNLKLGNVIGIPNGGSSEGILIPNDRPQTLQAALAGFNLSFGGEDHHMQTASASVGTSLSGTQAKVTGQAKMYDDNGHVASTATVDGGLIANCDPSLAMTVLSTGSLQGNSQVLNFPAGITNFVSMLSGFQVQYENDSDHHVKTIKAELLVQSVSGSSVTVGGKATLLDNNGHEQDNTVSNVTGFVIGY